MCRSGVCSTWRAETQCLDSSDVKSRFQALVTKSDDTGTDVPVSAQRYRTRYTGHQTLNVLNAGEEKGTEQFKRFNSKKKAASDPVSHEVLTNVSSR